ncbi:MAG: MarR family transcriptional regulator [Chloroflexota bacterium]
MREWTFITNHGLVLAHVARHPQSTAREVAQAISITERTIHKIIADLETEGYIERQRVGRNNVYGIHSHLGLRHETTGDVEVGDLLRVLGWRQRRNSSG